MCITCRVPNAKEGRGGLEWEVFGMAGVPDGMMPGGPVPEGAVRARLIWAIPGPPWSTSLNPFGMAGDSDGMMPGGHVPEGAVMPHNKLAQPYSGHTQAVSGLYSDMCRKVWTY